VDGIVAVTAAMTCEGYEFFSEEHSLFSGVWHAATTHVHRQGDGSCFRMAAASATCAPADQLCRGTFAGSFVALSAMEERVEEQGNR
jgi:hypothetical protein